MSSGGQWLQQSVVLVLVNGTPLELFLVHAGAIYARRQSCLAPSRSQTLGQREPLQRYSVG